MGSSSRMPKTVISQVIIVAVLLLLLLALSVAYLLLTSPPKQQTTTGQRERQFLFSIYGFEGDLLRRPTGVGFDDQGNIYVADTGKRRIVVFDQDGGFIRVFGEAGKGDLLIYDPIDVAVAPDGRAWVVDRTQSKLVIYDQTGVAEREIVTPEPPTSITIANDQVFVTVDSGVLIADLEGNLLTGYIARGKEPGQFDRPGGVAVAEDGTLYVADSLNYRVQAISTKGEPLWQYGQPLPPDQAIQFDDPNRKFGLPANIAVDENGLIYVVDGMNSEVVVLDSEGNFVETIGDVGGADGMFYYPDGIDYRDGRIAVADKFNDRVEVFRVPLPPGQRWRAYVPYVLGLLLLPLLLIPFLRARRRYVVTPDFVDALAADEARADVADALKRVYSTEPVAVAGRAIEDVTLKWIDRSVAEEDVEKVVERFGLDRDKAGAVVVAAVMRGKRVLITDDEQVTSVARELKVPVATYAEIKRALERSKGSKRPGGPSAPAQTGDAAQAVTQAESAPNVTDTADERGADE